MVNSVYEYLIQHFEANEPILKSDIILPISEVNLRQVLKRLCDAGNLKRYSPGVYYLPKESPLKFSVPFSPEDVASKKYIKSNCNYIGYYSGFTFANQLGISTQVPYIMEITSNIASAKSRTIQIRGQKFLLRKSRIQITNDNWQLLQLLDLLKDIVLFCFDGILSAIVSVVGAIPSPSFLSNGLNSVVSQFSPQLAYYLNFSGLSQGLLIIAAGYLFHLLRKFATLFQW